MTIEDEIMNVKHEFVKHIDTGLELWDQFKSGSGYDYLGFPHIKEYSDIRGKYRAEMLADSIIRRIDSSWSVMSSIRHLLISDDYVGSQVSIVQLCRSIVEQTSKVYWFLKPAMRFEKPSATFIIERDVATRFDPVVKRLLRMELYDLHEGIKHLASEESNRHTQLLNLYIRHAREVFPSIDFDGDWYKAIQSGQPPIDNGDQLQIGKIVNEYIEICNGDLFTIHNSGAGYGLLSFFTHSPHYTQWHFMQSESIDGVKVLRPRHSLDPVNYCYVGLMMSCRIAFLIEGTFGVAKNPFSQFCLFVNQEHGKFIQKYAGV